jgi:hypothetical protein
MKAWRSAGCLEAWTVPARRDLWHDVGSVCMYLIRRDIRGQLGVGRTDSGEEDITYLL